jgi:hypothetical protein
MGDIGDVVGSAINPGRKATPEAALRQAVQFSPAEQASSDARERSPENLQVLQSAIDSESRPQYKAELEQEKAKLSAQPNSGMGDIGSVVSGVIASRASAPAETAPASEGMPKASGSPPDADKPGMLTSAAAGAGKAVGTGVLALQQLAGKGASLAGDVAGSDSLKNLGSWLSTDARQGVAKLDAENAPYEAENPKSNLAGQVTGMVLSPVNKLVPGFGGAASSLTGAAIKGAGQGAILNAATAPVTDDSKPFLQEKIRQGAVGAIGGAAGSTLGHGLAWSMSKGLEMASSGFNRLKAGDTAATADAVVSKALAAQGIDKSAITPELFDGLKSQAQDALKSGATIDKSALVRLTQAQTLPVPVPMLKGQITRDPMQFAKEQNLRGIEGVGEPITHTLQAQNKALIANLDAIGADKGTDVVTGGKNAIDTLLSADTKAQKVVSGTYDAYKKSTGKDLDVPLGGLAQDYTKTLGEFGDAIPSSIRNKFEGLGLVSGKQTQTFSINDAEGLIKSINRNYDPSNKVQARALDDLRNHVQDAIANGAGSSAEGAEAAFLAKSAREAASGRFKGISNTPGLKDAIAGSQPDKFIQKHILQGNEAHIQSMMDVLRTENPAQADALGDAMMTLIKGRVLSGHSSENGIFSQAQLKNYVTDPNMVARLTPVLGKQRMAQLKQLNQVAEDALYTPKAAAVNSSNTTSAAANLIKNEVQGGALNKLLTIGKGIPGLSTAAAFAQGGVQSSKASTLISEAVNPSVGKKAATTPIRDFAQLGARAGASYAENKAAKRPQP